MTLGAGPLGRHLVPELDDGRLARQFAVIRARVGPGKSRAWAESRFAMAAALAAAFVIVASVFPRAGGVRLHAAAVLEGGAAGETQIPWVDGSHLTLGASSRARVDATNDATLDLRLERGSVAVHAAAGTTRQVRIRAAGHLVVGGARGSRLSFLVSVTPSAGDAAVSVAQGSIAVTRPDGRTRVVGEGESWSSAAEIAEAPPTPLRIGASPTIPAEVTNERAPSRHAVAGARSATPSRLLDHAQRALADGRLREAARLFDALRRRHRSDGRAGLAAFELGRLRLDQFDDPVGAEEAFRDAVTLPLPASIREDAEARVVQALDRMGARDRCLAARDAYLAGFPAGVHRRTVGVSCGGR